MKTHIYYSDNQNDTELLGRNFAEILSGHEIITLNGDLGVGKTVFVKGVAKGLDICETVTSPTYTIVHEYNGRFPLYHFDVYRIDVEELEDIGFYDYLRSGVCIIEWASVINDILPENCIDILIERVDENVRKISVSLPEGMGIC